MQETTRAETGMAYRYWPVAMLFNQGTARKSRVLVVKEIRTEITEQTLCGKRKRKMNAGSPLLGLP